MGALEPAAATAASLLARGNLAGGKTPSVPGLIALVDERLAYHPRLRHALQEARAQPEDPARVGVLAQALMTLGEADPVFGRKLGELINHAQQALWIGGIVTQVYGHAQVGKLVTIGQAGDIHVHLPAAPPPTVLDRLPATQRGPLVSNLPPPATLTSSAARCCWNDCMPACTKTRPPRLPSHTRSPCMVWVASARPSSLWSTPTARPPTTT